MPMVGIRTPVLFAYQSLSTRIKVLQGKTGCGAAAIRKRFLNGHKLFNRAGNPVTRFDLPDGQPVILRHKYGTIKIVVQDGDVANFHVGYR